MPGPVVGTDISAVEHHDDSVALDLRRQGCLHGAACDLLCSRSSAETESLQHFRFGWQQGWQQRQCEITSD